ncbi:MAG TPA: glycosyltransferase family 4 protein [Gaiellaceae bacterium]|jgi:glycosyltransferase involved in cell wall biosynthesis
MLRGRRNRYDVAFYVPWIGALLTNADVTPTGGAETQIYLVARALAERGVSVCLLAFELPGVQLPRDVGGVAVRVRRPYQAHRRLGKLRETAALASSIFGSGAAVIVTRAAGPHVGLAAVAAKLSGRRFVFSTANVSDFDFGRLSPSRANDALFRLGVRLADRIIVQTMEQKRMCNEAFHRDAMLIKSIAEPATQRTREPKAFLWIARLVWYKRPLEYIQLARLVPEAMFWMVGVRVPLASEEDDLVNEVERAAADVPNLELLPSRPRQELLELVDACVAVVNTADFEGMPNIFLEGWERGVPALALTHDPDGVIESHDVGWFAHGSRERLVELARTAWGRRDDQASIAERCRAYVRDEHSADAVAARWRDALGLQ